MVEKNTTIAGIVLELTPGRLDNIAFAVEDVSGDLRHDEAGRHCRAVRALQRGSVAINPARSPAISLAKPELEMVGAGVPTV
jgi:hypothetical protein